MQNPVGLYAQQLLDKMLQRFPCAIMTASLRLPSAFCRVSYCMCPRLVKSADMSISLGRLEKLVFLVDFVLSFRNNFSPVFDLRSTLSIDSI